MNERGFVKIVIIVIAGLFAAMLGVRAQFGGGQRLPDRTGTPELPGSVLETVADLDYPPGNIAVSATGRIFFTLHPDGKPPTKVHELVDGRPVPYPDARWQEEAEDIPYFQSILSLRIDGQNRLWVLDFAEFGRGQPRLTAFDLATGALVHHYDFPSDVAGLGSMLNDLQISPDGGYVYIAETSPIVHHPAIIVYDVARRRSRRVLDRHASVVPENLIIQAPGRDMRVYDLVTLRIGVDSIALDKSGEWLYYGPVTGGTLYRVRASDLADESLPPQDLEARVERFADKTLSDGLTMDLEGNVYLSDMEHSAVLALGPDRRLRTLVKDERLRWPDGFSFGPDGWLYVTCSALQHVLFVGRDEVKKHAPYQIFRFRPGPAGVPGH